MHRHRITRAVSIAAVSLGAFAAVLLLVGVAQQGRILPNTMVAGMDAGGLDIASARRVLGPTLAAEERHPLKVSLPGEQILLDPREVGLRVDVDGTVADAFARGRSWSPVSLPIRLLATVLPGEIEVRRSVDEARIASWVDAAADRIERPSDAGSFKISQDADAFLVSISGPQGALSIDRRASADRLRAALLDGERNVRMVASVELPPNGRGPIERIASDVSHALRQPIVLRHDGRTLSIAPEVIAQIVDVALAEDSTGRPEPTLDVPVARVRALLGTDGRTTFDREARDARIVTQRVPETTLSELGSTAFRPVETRAAVESGNSHVRFDAELAAAQIQRLISARQYAALADVDEVDPELTTAAALAGRPTHLLGTFTTFYAAGGPRTVNIRLLADILDDHVIAPGETFSVNGTSGPRRCEDGFLPAGTIVRGELVDTCGGGVSQIGTTVVNAAFFAGVPLEQWQPHSFFISRYPAGREATLSYPELDVRFTNDTDGYLVLRASTTPESVTVALYGVPRWREVRAEHGERRAPTDFSVEERRTTSLRPGARRVVQAGGGGFTITVTRTRVPVAADGTTETERWTTVYRPQQRIVEVGVSVEPE